MTEKTPDELGLDDPFDREYLRKNYLELGCGDVLQDVFRIFQESSLIKLEGLRKALDAGAHQELFAIAHGMKGESGSVGGRHVSALASAMEQAARAGNIMEVRRLFADLERELGRLLTAIARELEE